MKYINTVLKEVPLMSVTPVQPFWIVVRKEVSDHVRSWRFIILVALILLTTTGSIYTVLSVIRENPAELSANTTFLYLKLFTESTNNLPPIYHPYWVSGTVGGHRTGFRCGKFRA